MRQPLFGPTRGSKHERFPACGGVGFGQGDGPVVPGIVERQGDMIIIDENGIDECVDDLALAGGVFKVQVTEAFQEV